MKKLLLIAAVAIVLVATAVVVAHAYGQICYGKVVGEDGRQPLPGAAVSLYYSNGNPTGINGFSWRDGTFTLGATMPAGNYICRVSMAGYATRDKAFYYNGTTAVNLGSIRLSAI